MEELIKNFIKYIQMNNLPFESVCLSNKEGLILSHHFIKMPRRNIYSHTKSFTSTLIGIAIEEGLLTLEDNLFDYFKENIKDDKKEQFQNIKLKHLLNMSSGLGDSGFLFGSNRSNGEGFPDYIEYMMNKEKVHEPGTHFAYSNADTYLAGCMLEKASNMTLMEYATTHLFNPLGIKTTTWGSCPKGHCFGASELFLTIEEMTKLGVLFLNKGKWNSKQIISEEWVEKCSKSQIDVGYEDNFTKGYSNQWWICNFKDAYRADGMYGQITIVFPNEGYVFSMQCPDYADAANSNINHFIKEVIEKMV